MTTTPTVWLAQHQVNFTDSGDQGDPEIVAIGNGRYVVVWTEASYNTNPVGPIAPQNGSDIVGQIFDAAGNRIGNEFLVNYSFSGDHERHAAMAKLPNGGFVVVYEDAGADGTSIRAQQFDVNGNALAGGPTTIHVSGSASYTHPTVAVRPDGGYHVAYSESPYNGYWLRTVDVNGTIHTTRYYPGGVRSLDFPDIAVLTDGAHVAVYEMTRANKVFMLSVSSSNIVEDFFYDTYLTVTDAKVAPLVGGGFVIAWTQGGGDGDGTGIVARIFDNTGRAIRNAWPVSTLNAEGDQDEAQVIALNDGGFVVVWDNDYTSDIRGQRFDAAGNFVGTEFIAGSANGDETLPTVALLSDGRFIVGFQRTDGDNDILATIFDPRETTVSGNSGNETIVGPTGGGTVNGLGGNDTLQGSSGQDNLNGGTGNDTLIGGSGAGNDYYDGGSGIDTIVFSSTNLGVTVNLSAAANQAVGAQTGIDQIANVEDVIGGSGNDRITGNAAINRLEGRGGNDTYGVNNAGDKVIELAGQGTDIVTTGISYALTAGSSVEYLRTLGASTTAAINLTGNNLSNTLVGNKAVNVLNGGAAADTMAGGFGNDIYRVDNRLDKVIEVVGQGTDTVIAAVSFGLKIGSSVETLRTVSPGSTTPINLTGNNLANKLYGNAAANALDGGAGADIMIGGSGNDTYRVDNQLDRVIEVANQGNDVVSTAISYALQANSDVNLLRTSNPSSTAALSLTGNGLAQTIQGNAGANVITGAGGKDTMSGGGGRDRLDFNTVAEIGHGATRDVINDFTHLTDKIDLSTIDANGAAAGHSFLFLAAQATAFTGVAGELRWFRQDVVGTANDRTIIEGDTNGDRIGDFQIQLKGSKLLTATDFLL